MHFENYHLYFYYFHTAGSYDVKTAYGSMYSMASNWWFIAPTQYIADGTVYAYRILGLTIKGSGHDFPTNPVYQKTTTIHTDNYDYSRAVTFSWINAQAYTINAGAGYMYMTILFVDNE